MANTEICQRWVHTDKDGLKRALWITYDLEDSLIIKVQDGYWDAPLNCAYLHRLPDVYVSKKQFDQLIRG